MASDVTCTGQLTQRTPVHYWKAGPSTPPLPGLWFQVFLKRPVHLHQACSRHEGIGSVAGELAEAQAKAAGMG